jgi:hypothetical protein
MVEFIIKYWVEVAFGIVLAVLGYFSKTIMQYRSDAEATKAGVRALLQDRIIQVYKYHKSRNCVDLYDRKIVDDMYQQYKKLGGNGMIEDIMDKLLDLPISCQDELEQK